MRQWGFIMLTAEVQQQFEKIIHLLPETKIHAVIDFADYLLKQEESQQLFHLQRGSQAYQEWLSPDNDIYDELFKDEIQER